ncbi:MAG: PEP-CTERM sorting domain-containing protein [Verrucomicrobiota bacterium]|jgi:hypothetical protein
MKILKKSFAGRVWWLQGALFAFLLAGLVVQSEAQIYTLSARDTSVQINLAGGISDWTIDGVNQLNRQWFYYSVGSGLVYSIDTIALWSVPSTTPGNSPTLTETYANSTISVQTKYTLQSSPSGSGMAKLLDTITVKNTSSSTSVYHFFQFSDFDLGGVSGNQNVQFNSDGAGTAYQVVQTGLTGATLVGTVTALSGGSSVPPEEQAGYYGTQFGLVNGNPAPTLNNTLTAGPGNVVYAYEWDMTLSPNGVISISEIQYVPEPSSVALISSGMLVLALLRRRHRKA